MIAPPSSCYGDYAPGRRAVERSCNSCAYQSDCLSASNYRVIQGSVQRELASNRQVAGTHYKDMGIEPWDVVGTWPLEQQIGAYRHGALKYLMRMGTKDEMLQEVQKSAHYIEKLTEVLSDASDTEEEGSGI